MTVASEVKTLSWRKPRIGQGRTGLRRKVSCVTPPSPSKAAQVISKPDLQNPEITTQSKPSLKPKPQIEPIPVVQTISGQ